MLLNPRAEVIDKGGEIFFATCNNAVAGTVSMIKLSDEVFEMAKLAVDDEFQGMGIGKKLIQKCIDFALEKGVRKIIFRPTASCRAPFTFTINSVLPKSLWTGINMPLRILIWNSICK